MGVSTDRPGLDMGRPDWGPEMAGVLLAQLLPGRAFQFVGTQPFVEGVPAECVGLTVFGDSAILHGMRTDELTLPEGMGTLEFDYSSASDAFQLEVRVPGRYHREVGYWPGMKVDEIDLVCRGEPLPFEAPFWEGAISPGCDEVCIEGDFDIAAMQWAFGYDPRIVTSEDLERSPISSLVTHVFRAAPAVVAQEEPRARRRWWRRG